MRPLYETDADGDREAAIIIELMRDWGYDESLKLSLAYRLDRALLKNGSIGCFVEAKHRDLKFSVRGGYYNSLLKLLAARALTDTTGLPCFLAVRFADGLVRWADYRMAQLAQVIRHGRNDRDDARDVEPEVVFRWEQFHLLGRTGR